MTFEEWGDWINTKWVTGKLFDAAQKLLEMMDDWKAERETLLADSEALTAECERLRTLWEGTYTRALGAEAELAELLTEQEEK